MTINVRVVGTANMTGMTAPFGKLEAQVTALNEQLAKMVALQKGVDPAGYERMAKAAAANSKNFRSAAASTGMFDVQQLRVNRATDDFIGKLQKQKLSFNDILKQRKLVIQSYRDQIRMEQMVARVSSTGTTHGKQTVETTVPTAVSQDFSTFNKKVGFTNALLKSGATQLTNWGKNAQWTGRQLSVGLTAPVVAFGVAAGVMGYQVDQALTRVSKVYNTTAKSAAGQQKELDQVRQAGLQTAMTAADQYGAAAKDTINVQAELAASGKSGVALQKDTLQVMRISVLGELDYNDAIKTTIALQSVWNMNTKELTKSFNYMNAIENATSLQTEDFAKAIPIAAGPVKAFGGNIQELGVLLTAMREKGIQATQGANAIKAAMQRLGRPSETVQKDWTALTHTDITQIFDKSTSLLDLFTRINKATENLGRKDKIKAFAGLFGTYQVTRMMALVEGMKELHDTTTQTGKAFQIAQQSGSKWAAVASKEISRYQNSISGQWDIAIHKMQLELAEMGKPFVKVATFIISKLSGVLNVINDLSGATKGWLGIFIAAGASAGPILMLTGLMGNLVGSTMRGISVLIGLFARMKLMTSSQRASEMASESATTGYLGEVSAVDQLTVSLEALVAAQKYANEQTRQMRVSQLVATQGMTPGRASATVLHQDLESGALTMGPMQEAEKSSGRLSTYLKTGALSMGGLVAGSAILATSTNKTADLFAKILITASLLGPLFVGLGPKLAASLGKARLAMAGVAEGESVMGAGAAAFTAEMGIGTVATAGVLAGVVAIGGGLLLLKHHQDDIAARQKEILDAQLKANSQLENSTASIATNMGKAAGSYKQIANPVGAAASSTLGGGQAMARYDYYKGAGSGEVQGFVNQGTGALYNASTLMDKVRQKFVDLQVLGKDTAKQATVDLTAMLTAAGMSAGQAQALVEKVYKRYGDISKLDWTKPLRDQAKAFSDIANNNPLLNENHFAVSGGRVSVSGTTYSVNTATEAYIAQQAKKSAAIFQQALASAQGNPGKEKQVIAQFMQIALQQWNAGFKSLSSQSGAGFDQINQIFAKYGVTSGKSFASAWEKNADFKGALENILKNPAYKQAAAELNKATLGGETWEKNVIVPLSKSSTILSDSIWNVVDAIKAYSKAGIGQNSNQAASMVTQTQQYIKFIALQKQQQMMQNKGMQGTAAYFELTKQLNGANQDLTKSVNKLNAEYGFAQGTNALQALYNLTHHVKDGTDDADKSVKKMGADLAALPSRTDITLSVSEISSIAHDSMAGVQDQISTDAEAQLDAAQSAQSQQLQYSQQAASQALQNRQQDASDALDKKFKHREDEINKAFKKREASVNHEIKVEQDADKKRQAMFEAEKQRLQDLADAANNNIDFNTALNEGNFDEAAKVRNDAEAAKGQQELDAEEKRSEAQSNKVIKRLQKRLKELDKTKDKELKNLSTVEDAAKKHLARMQQMQSDALQKNQDAQTASLQAQQDAYKNNLEAQLTLFKSFVPKSQKELQDWMKQVGLSYDQFGKALEAKGETWAEYFKTALTTQVRIAGNQVVSSDMWSKIGAGMANKLLKGIGFKNQAAFMKFINTGILTQEQRGAPGNDVQHHPNVPKPHHHAGGVVGYAPDSRGGISKSAPMHRSEVDIRAQHGEFIVNRNSSKKHMSLLNRINSGMYDSDAHGGPGYLPVAGFMAGVISSMFGAGVNKGIRNVAKNSKQISAGPGNIPGGAYVPGPGGRHRPVIGYPPGADNGWEGGFNAVDLPAPIGTKLYAIADGTITSSYDIPGYEPRREMYGQTGASVQDGYRSYGRVITMRTNSGENAIFGHLSKRGVGAGQHVKGGSVIGLTGNTGNVQSSIGNGAHLHFGVNPGSPYAWLRNGGTVKWDNTPAILHKGETVLTDNLTKQFKDNVANRGGDTYNVNVTVPGTDCSAEDIAKTVLKVIERREDRKPVSRRNRP